MSTATISQPRASITDLYRVEGKAELIGGRIVRMASGMYPSRVAFRIAMRLEEFKARIKRGEAFPDGMGYEVPELPSGRESFSPDASYYDGPLPVNRMRFIAGAPTFAAEVRSENDYGDAAEEGMAAKRADYFAAKTQVVWDVDPLAQTIAVCRITDPTRPTVYHRGAEAEAEPALAGWRIAVAGIFDV